MTKIFVPNSLLVIELIAAMREIEAAGYDKNQAFVGSNFSAFTEPLKKGDTAVVYSLIAFRSVTEILSQVERLSERGVELRSVCEPWFSDPTITNRQLLAHLFRLGERLHTAQVSTVRVLRNKKRPLDIVARVALALELRTTHRLSVAAACRTAGCSVSSYYAHNKNR